MAPRPVGWISTLNKAGEINLAPYSFFNAVSTRPFIVWFSSEGEKDSASFAQETGEFVANLVSRDLAEKMNYTSVNAPPGVNEFVYADLAMAPSRLVKPPRVAAAPAALECRVTEVFRPRALDGTPTSAVVVAGEVRRKCLPPSRVQAAFRPAADAGGRTSCRRYRRRRDCRPPRTPRRLPPIA